MTVNDVALLTLLFIFVSLLVKRYLKRPFFAKKFRSIALAGGWAWLVYSFLGEEFAESVLAIGTADAPIHGRMTAGDQRIARFVYSCPHLSYNSIMGGHP